MASFLSQTSVGTDQTSGGSQCVGAEANITGAKIKLLGARGQLLEKQIKLNAGGGATGAARCGASLCYLLTLSCFLLPMPMTAD